MLRVAMFFLFLSVLFPQWLPAAEGGRQDDDGRIVFTADDGRIVGETDLVSWDYKPSRWGMYDVEVLQGCGPGQGGSVMTVAVDAGQHTLRITPKQIAKQAACNIRQVRLVPAKPEG